MKAIILAAGFGSRLMPLTKDNPKCMVKYQNEELISYEIKALKDAGISDIAVVGGYLFDILKKFIQERFNLYTFYENKNYANTNMVQTLFCAREFLQKCVEQKEDLIVSYADIIYFKDSIEKLMQAKDDLAIVIDKEWKKLWQKRFENPLDDAETLKLDNKGFIKELGKKAKSYDEIEGQYIGLFKISANFLPSFLNFYDSLDKNILYDGKDFNNMYMTSFLQSLIDTFNNAKAIEIYGNWCEIDFKSDLGIVL
ncbi:phosphocholine cytidylyltransferase family protein [Campylobacter novaezeelandiae]|uniref:Phosphocholine cytidylyltransferase family protein n=2 Tax=Campylobacter novaezeelandiae TaxID=2267891 RepID=A0A4Q9JTP9_9BACT|nr:phosphocholine cytidylyltransferase family protein [Campylobacter novaezeelandiae]QWU80405.1 phosphoramidate cytidylyltransferase [Campylobacter novaezeelandiae]TBR77919.1 phosphocholine cytidylyltransferase family protein [Campylobacter novaezeelandiae]TBR78763.1 phosphocholine cytidylyltransferase family protein [Campylobacter novaezeelandiae]TBR80523.1 phosphocholine cytidylyltransferase family protein [Campylobacter novaezeelandiae]TBR80662.1 phosphocholine cytidylyltransferase family p